MKNAAMKALLDVKNIEAKDKQKEKEMSKRMIQGKKEQSVKQIVIEEGVPETEEVVQQTLFGVIWSWALYLMWLPMAIPIRIAKYWFDIVVSIMQTLLPYFVSVWKLICKTTPVLAEYAECIPLIGTYIAWIFRLPERFNLKEFLQLILSFVKKRPEPEVVDVNSEQTKKTQ